MPRRGFWVSQSTTTARCVCYSPPAQHVCPPTPSLAVGVCAWLGLLVCVVARVCVFVCVFVYLCVCVSVKYVLYVVIKKGDIARHKVRERVDECVRVLGGGLFASEIFMVVG